MHALLIAMLTQRRIIVFIITVALMASAACAVTAVRTGHATDNPEVRIELLATFDGIRLYRVDVGTRYIYVAKSVNGEVAANWMHQQGKLQIMESVTTLP